MRHSEYGLTMADGLWRASCDCDWRSAASPDLAEQTAELDQHLRVVVVAEQRPGLPTRLATGAVLRAVDHTVALGALLLAVALAAPVRFAARA